MRNKIDHLIFGLALLAMVLLAWTFVPANYHVVHNMTWRYAEPAAQYPASKHIVLTFEKYPNEYIGIYSPDLGRYLESLPDHRVEVLFEVSPVLGGMHGSDWFNPVKLVKLNVSRLRGDKWHQPVEIGGFVQWTTDYTYNSRSLNVDGAALWE